MTNLLQPSADELQRLSDAPGTKWSTARPKPDAIDTEWAAATAAANEARDRDMVFALLRVGIARLKLHQFEFEEIGTSLRSGYVTAAGAIEWLRSVDAAQFCTLPASLDEEKAA